MNLLPEQLRTPEIPLIVRVILRYVARQRYEGDITAEAYEQKLSRLRREELVPNGFTLMERPLPDGRTRFLIKESSTGNVRDMLEWGPA